MKQFLQQQFYNGVCGVDSRAAIAAAPPVVPKAANTGKSTTLKLGDKAPDFALPNGAGKHGHAIRIHPAVSVLLVFYRGFW